MATNDFVVDIVEKMSEDNVEFLVISLQKGKQDNHKANAYYHIQTTTGAEILLTTIEEIFNNDDVSKLVPDTWLADSDNIGADDDTSESGSEDEDDE